MPEQPRSRAKTTPKTSRKTKAESKRVKATKAEKIVTHGTTPTAIVSTSLGLIKKFRLGRGFSRSELHAVGLEAGKARRLGLRVDLRRGTEWSENVKALKKWLTVPKKASRTVKKVETASKARRKR